MDVTKLLLSVEDAVFEIALWALSLPKICLRAVFTPWWIYDYVLAEWDKEEDQKFSDGIPPVIFWLVAGVFPYLYLVGYFTSLPVVPRDPDHLFQLLVRLQPELRYLAVALLHAAGPLGFALQIGSAREQQFNRNALQRRFSVQCPILAVAALLFLPIVASWIAPEYHQAPLLPERGQNILAWTAILWFLFAETCILRRELAGQRTPLPMVFVMCVLRWLLMVVLLESVVVVAIMASRTIESSPPASSASAVPAPSGERTISKDFKFKVLPKD